jgi:hypothetical protein
MKAEQETLNKLIESSKKENFEIAEKLKKANSDAVLKQKEFYKL